MHKKFLLFLLPAVLLTGCGKNPKNLSDLEGGTPADSMMYYFGEMQAANYWQDAETDTLLRTDDAREEFMKGFRAALKMETDNPAYNKGLQLGLRLAIRLREFDDHYGMNFSESILAASMENALKKGSDFNMAESQQGFYRLKDLLDLKTAAKEVEAAKGNLAKEAKAKGFSMLSDTLYFKNVTNPSNAPKLKLGDRVAVEVTASTLDGKEIATRQFPDSITLGQGRVPVIVRMGILTMTDGQTRSFMTTPRTLLGKRYAVYNLPYEKPVIFTVKAGGDIGAPAASGYTED